MFNNTDFAPGKKEKTILFAHSSSPIWSMQELSAELPGGRAGSSRCCQMWQSLLTSSWGPVNNRYALWQSGSTFTTQISRKLTEVLFRQETSFPGSCPFFLSPGSMQGSAGCPCSSPSIPATPMGKSPQNYHSVPCSMAVAVSKTRIISCRGTRWQPQDKQGTI